MKIMIVDDSGVMRRIHKNSLKEHEIDDESLLEAEDGIKALEMAKNEKINIFLVDWNMPKLDGLAFIKTLRKIDVYKSTPMIMITSEAARYNVMEAITGGVTDYIVKPIKGEMLWEKIVPYINEVKNNES